MFDIITNSGNWENVPTNYPWIILNVWKKALKVLQMIRRVYIDVIVNWNVSSV